MDILFILGAIGLWGAMVLLVMGFGRLDQPTKGQS